MKKKWLSVVLAGAMTVSLAGCGGGTAATAAAPATEAKTEAAGSKTEEAQAEDGKTEAAAPEAGADVAGKTVAFVPKLTGNAFFESANNGAQEYSKGWGFTVDYQGSANAAVADQVNVINNAVASGVDAICISSVDATGLDSALAEAKEAGVTVVTWDSDVSDTARTLMVSQGTPDLLGKMLVDMGADSLTNRGKDTKKDTIKYCWHYSQATVADQNYFYTHSFLLPNNFILYTNYHSLQFFILRLNNKISSFVNNAPLLAFFDHCQTTGITSDISNTR